ncbi:hypothetical protein ACFVZH_37020 [Streptomyces sp. NPDC059534]|uniref:hypothetical protein n=1 Tax=Streptomyces sp. NPDC059534 TaxID=3346859 RepID=UPI00368B9F8E
MRWPQKPTITVEDVLKACTPWLKKQGWDEDMQGRLPELVGQQRRYRTAGEEGDLFSLLVSEFGGQCNDEEKDRLTATYDRALVGGGGRKIYDALKAAAIYGCTMCGVAKPETIDHHAPKTVFPLLALTPLNLVPACGPCNQGKSNSFSTDPAKEPFHPYFDDLGSDRWLFADICPADGGAVAEFSVRPPANWPEVKAKRLAHHFTSNKLAPMYKFEASHHLSARRRKDMRTHARTGPEGLREVLTEDADSIAAVDPNDRETAWLYALADCDWYINGGMMDI